MSDTYYPGSSPPEINLPPPLEPKWEPIEVKGSGRYATWRQMGYVPWQVDFDEGMQCAENLYRDVVQLENGKTKNGTCMAAALIIWFQEEVDNAWSDIKSMIFLSTIPRGQPHDTYTVYGMMTRHPHPTWKSHSSYLVRDPKSIAKARQMEGPTTIHAEDGAIDMCLRFKDKLHADWVEAQNPPAPSRNTRRSRHAPEPAATPPPRVQWLTGWHMPIFGQKAIKVDGPLDKKGKPTTKWTVTAPSISTVRNLLSDLSSGTGL